jgi:hypothetical protein
VRPPERERLTIRQPVKSINSNTALMSRSSSRPSERIVSRNFGTSSGGSAVAARWTVRRGDSTAVIGFDRRTSLRTAIANMPESRFTCGILRALYADPGAVAEYVEAAASIATSQQARFYSGLVGELAPEPIGTAAASGR